MTIRFEELGKDKVVVVREAGGIAAGLVIFEKRSLAQRLAQERVAIPPVDFEIKDPKEVVDPPKTHADIAFRDMENAGQIGERAEYPVAKPDGPKRCCPGNGRG